MAILLGQLGYPCARGDAAQRIATLLEDPTQSLVVAEFHGDLCGRLALETTYYLPLGAPTCRITSLIVDEAHRRDALGGCCCARRSGAPAPAGRCASN